MAVEQQLVDYIKKARSAGQLDDQSRALLYKNGWTVAEVDEAVASMTQPQIQPKPQFQAQAKPQIQQQPQQPQNQQQQVRQQYQSKNTHYY